MNILDILSIWTFHVDLIISVEPPCVTIENKGHVIKEWTSIHVFCRTAELAFNQDSTSSRKLNRISEYHKNTIFTILIIFI